MGRQIRAGLKLLSVPRGWAHKRTCPRLDYGPQEFPAGEREPDRSPTLRLRASCPSHISGRRGRAALKSGYWEDGVKERERSHRRGRLEDEAQLGCGRATGADTPPVDEEPSREGDGDLLGATAIGGAQFLSGPDNAPILALELEEAPGRFLAPESQPRTAVFVDRTEPSALSGGVFAGAKSGEARHLLGRLEACPIADLALEHAHGEGPDSVRRGWCIRLQFRFTASSCSFIAAAAAAARWSWRASAAGRSRITFGRTRGRHHSFGNECPNASARPLAALSN